MAWRTLILKLSPIGGASPFSPLRRVPGRSFSARSDVRSESDGGEVRPRRMELFDEEEIFKEMARATIVHKDPRRKDPTYSEEVMLLLDPKFCAKARANYEARQAERQSEEDANASRHSVSTDGSCKPDFDLDRSLMETIEMLRSKNSRLGKNSNADKAPKKPFLHGAPHVPKYGGSKGRTTLNQASSTFTAEKEKNIEPKDMERKMKYDRRDIG